MSRAVIVMPRLALSLALLGLLTGCDPEQEAPPRTTNEDMPATETVQPETPKVAPKPRPVPEEVDLIGDKPEAAAAEAKSKRPPLLEDIKPQGPLGRSARQAYSLIADLKTNFDIVTKDLDDQGKEITRLIRTTDALGKSINELADLWAANQTFRDICGAAKRSTMLLNDELSNSPRKWAHVRWAHNAVLPELRRLRQAAQVLAEAEPKPTPVVGKDGKTTYVEPDAAPVDPAIAEKERKLREVQAVKDRLRKIEDARKNKPLQTELD